MGSKTLCRERRAYLPHVCLRGSLWGPYSISRAGNPGIPESRNPGIPGIPCMKFQQRHYFVSVVHLEVRPPSVPVLGDDQNIRSTSLVKANLKNGDSKYSCKGSPDNSPKSLLPTQTSAPRNNLALPSWRPKVTEAWKACWRDKDPIGYGTNNISLPQVSSCTT